MSEYAVTNPATGELVASYPTDTDAQILAAVDAAAAAATSWRAVPLAERTALLHRIADLYVERTDALAAIVTREMGKPIAQARGEMQIVEAIFRYYAENAESFLAEESIPVARGTATVRSEPLGALLGIMPWNYPHYQVARFAAPNLALGNTIILKHAPQCPESARAIAELFADAGAPAGTYVSVFASTAQVAAIIADPRVHGVSLTGSERAGAAVAEIAGRNLTKAVLELGGSDPFIVLEDADVERAVGHAVRGRFGNAGQACNAAKRIILTDAVYDEFAAKFVAAVAAITLGDPGAEETFLGPLSSEAAARGLAEQVDDAVADGASVLLAGGRINRPGAWFAPTVLADVTPVMRAYREELFGPVAVLYRVADADAAVALANDSDFGLGASVHGADRDRAEAVADRLEVGMVAINAASGSAAELPFGGVKRSGIGRELGRFGMAEFVNKKLVRR